MIDDCRAIDTRAAVKPLQKNRAQDLSKLTTQADPLTHNPVYGWSRPDWPEPGLIQEELGSSDMMVLVYMP